MKMKLQSKNTNLVGLVDDMMHEQNNNPRDISFRFTMMKRPEAAHKTYNLPGKYVKALKTEAITEYGSMLQMDYSVLVMPEDIIHYKSTLNVEHQSTELTDEKIKTIYEYKLSLIHDTLLPSTSIVITHIDPGERVQYFYSHDQVFLIIFIVITREEIYERLNILKNKINNNETLTEEESLNFSFIATFVDDEVGKEVMEELCELFDKTKLDTRLKCELHFVLKKMIKHHFKNDENKIREMLTMITQGISKENYALVEYAQKEGVEMETINRIIEQTSKTIEQKDKALTEKDNTIEQKNKALTEKDNTIEQKDKALTEKDNTIEQKDKALTQEREKNARQQKKIEYLQEQLRLKNG